jgi:hypothetical protein
MRNVKTSAGREILNEFVVPVYSRQYAVASDIAVSSVSRTAFSGVIQPKNIHPMPKKAQTGKNIFFFLSFSRIFFIIPKHLRLWKR